MLRRLTSRSLPTAWLALAGSCLVGCSGATNINRMWGKEDNAGDSLLVEGQAAYDSGDFDRAEALVQQLLDRNGDNEDASILLGFIHLSKGSIDAFSIARELVKQSNVNKAGTATASLDGTTATVNQDAANTVATDAASILTNLSDLVQIDDADRAKLYQHFFGASDNHDLSGTPVTPVLFTGKYALVVPALVGTDLRDAVPALKFINMAIKDVCRFVDNEVKVPEDSRDNGADCTQTPYTRSSAAKAHFLWALAHLAEALVFQPVVLWINPQSTVPSLSLVSTAITSVQVSSLSDITSLEEKVIEVKNAVNDVFNTSTDGSMVEATLLDLSAVIAAFSRMPGIPTKVQDSLTKAFTSITALGKELGSATSAANNTAGFKTQMTQAIAKAVGTKIQAASEQATALAKTASPADVAAAKAQVTQMCAQFKALNAGAPPSVISATQPKACAS